MFIGREAELKFLNDKYEENGGQLIVLYGRRRVGKTETLREFCKGKPHVFFSCTQTTDPVQLRNFSIRMMMKIFRQETISLRLQIGRERFGPYLIFLMATVKSSS